MRTTDPQSPPICPGADAAAIGHALERLADAADGLIRRVADQGLEAELESRRRQADADVADQIERARFVAAGLVEERRRRIELLSGEIVEQADALTAGLADAERIRGQFDRFVEALSVAAERLVGELGERAGEEPQSPSSSEPDLKRTSRTRPLIVTGPSSSISTSRPASPARPDRSTSEEAGSSGVAA